MDTTKVGHAAETVGEYGRRKDRLKRPLMATPGHCKFVKGQCGTALASQANRLLTECVRRERWQDAARGPLSQGSASNLSGRAGFCDLGPP